VAFTTSLRKSRVALAPVLREATELDASVNTGEAGRFRFEGPPASHFRMSVSASRSRRATS